MSRALGFSLSAVDDDILGSRRPSTVSSFPRRKSGLYALICLLWLVFGIIGRDPWKPEETVLVAIIADMVNNGLGVARLSLGEPYVAHPPLYLWLAAITATIGKALFSLPLHEGARLINIFLLALGFFFTGLSFRGSAGTRVAWLAVLLLIGATGFMIRAHVLNFGIPAFFGMSVVLWGLSALIGDYRRSANTLLGGSAVGIGIVFLFWSVGWLPMLVVTVAVLAAIVHNRGHAIVIIAVMMAFILPSIVWWGLTERAENIIFPQLFNKWRDLSPISMVVAMMDMLRIAIWSLFPLLPLAIMGIWVERRNLLPICRFAWIMVALSLLLFLMEGDGEEDFYILLPPLSLLAARALHKMPDGNARVFDFFALIVVGLFFGCGLWIVWYCLYTGSPVALADFLAVRFPGFSLPAISWLKITMAAILTIAWLALIANFGRSNERVAVNWAAGITFIWAVFNLLLVGYVDSGKSYRSPALAIAEKVRGSCLVAPVDQHWYAQLHYFGVRLGDASDCPFYLDTTTAAGALWRGGRGNDVVYNLHRQW